MNYHYNITGFYLIKNFSLFSWVLTVVKIFSIISKNFSWLFTKVSNRINHPNQLQIVDNFFISSFGRIDISSYEFAKMVDDCVVLIYPSYSKGVVFV